LKAEAIEVEHTIVVIFPSALALMAGPAFGDLRLGDKRRTASISLLAAQFLPTCRGGRLFLIPLDVRVEYRPTWRA
jgi:hypothetical protein